MKRSNIEQFYGAGAREHTKLSERETRELLKVLDEEEKHHLEDKTWKIINSQTRAILKQLPFLDTKTRREFYEKLKDQYRYVDEIHELERGKYVRWIRPDGKLTNGSNIANITTGVDGAVILCKNAIGQYTKFVFNNNTTFQKLTDAEKIILEVKDIVDADA